MATFHRVTRPSRTQDGLYAAALRFGDPRVMAVLGSLVGFCHVAVGLTNRDLMQLVGALSQEPYTSRQATYDLRRLIRKGLIVKIPHTRRYQLTTIGRSVAVLFTKTYGRVLAPGLGSVWQALLAARSSPPACTLSCPSPWPWPWSARARAWGSRAR